MLLCHPIGSKAWRKVWGIFSFAVRWSQVSHAVSFPHQTVNYADVPLVLFQPQMHVLTHAVKTAQVGGTSQLPVTFRNLHTQCKRWSNKGKTSLIIRRQSIRHMRKHATYPVVESRRPVRSSGEVVDSIVASVAWIQEQSHVLYVVLDGWLHPLCWVGHDYTGNISRLHFNCEGIVKGWGEGRIPTCYSGSYVGNIQIPFGIAIKIQVSRINLKDTKNIKKTVWSMTLIDDGLISNQSTTRS